MKKLVLKIERDNKFKLGGDQRFYVTAQGIGGVWGQGRSFTDAVAGFLWQLERHYTDLKREKATLGDNLLAELDYLEKMFEMPIGEMSYDDNGDYEGE